jgi:hypothetical protein
MQSLSDITFHTVVFLHKNALLSRRNWRSTSGINPRLVSSTSVLTNCPFPSAQLLIPFFVVAILVGFQAASDLILQEHIEFPQSSPIPPLQRCLPPRDGGDCTTLLYSPQGVPWLDSVMADVAQVCDNHVRVRCDA